MRLTSLLVLAAALSGCAAYPPAALHTSTVYEVPGGVYPYPADAYGHGWGAGYGYGAPVVVAPPYGYGYGYGHGSGYPAPVYRPAPAYVPPPAHRPPHRPPGAGGGQPRPPVAAGPAPGRNLREALSNGINAPGARPVPRGPDGNPIGWRPPSTD